ncbi:MAG: thrombospondin type 3 repeat-containing protein [Flavobacteriaceae bacterium]|nr:thrombospondin type 3 repeat-containing protein [Flavobacteriaceae bacterium]
MKKTFFAVLLFFSIALFSQEKYKPKFPEMFSSIPLKKQGDPEWVQILYGDDPNIDKLEFLFKKFYSKNKYIKNQNTQNYKFLFRAINKNLYHINSKGKVEKTDINKNYQSKKPFSSIKKNLKNDFNFTSIGPNKVTAHGNGMGWDGNGSEVTNYQVNIYSLYVFSNKTKMFCVTESGGIYVSSNGGDAWSNVTPFGKPSGHGGSSYITTTANENDNIIYYSSGKYLFKSEDFGNNWAVVDLEAQIYKIEYVDDKLYFAGAAGLFSLKNNAWDGGSPSISSITNEIYAGQIFDFEVVVSTGKIYLTKYNTSTKISEFYRSDNQGQTFNKKSQGWWAPVNGLDSGRGQVQIAVAKSSPNIIYAGILGNENDEVDDIGWIGLFKSTNSGETWVNMSPSGETGGPYSETNPCIVCNDLINPTYFQGWYDFDLVVSDSNPNQLWIGGIKKNMSNDGGATWFSDNMTQEAIISHHDIQDIVQVGNNLYIASDGGITKYDITADDIINKQSIVIGIHDVDFWGYGVGTNKLVMVGGTYHSGNKVLSSDFPSGAAQMVGGVEEGTGWVNKGDNNVVAAGKSYSSQEALSVLRISDDYGSAPEILTSNGHNPNESSSRSRRSDLETHPIYYDRVLFGKDNSIYFSNDFGINSLILYSFGNDPENLITDVKISSINPDIIFAVQGLFSSGNKALLHKSIDGGQTWNSIAVPDDTRPLNIDLNINDRLFVSSYNDNVYYSDNLGGSFTKLYDMNAQNYWPMEITAVDGTNKVLVLDEGYQTMYPYNKIFLMEENSMADITGNSLPGYVQIRDFEVFYATNKIYVSGNAGVWGSASKITPDQTFLFPLVQKYSYVSDQEIKLSTYTNIEKDDIDYYEWIVDGNSFTSTNYITTINSTSTSTLNINFESGQNTKLIDLQLKIHLTNGTIQTSALKEDAISVEKKIIINLFENSTNINFGVDGGGVYLSTLTLTGCEPIPLLTDAERNILIAQDFRTQTIALTHESFFYDGNTTGSSNIDIIKKFINNNSAKIIVATVNMFYGDSFLFTQLENSGMQIEKFTTSTKNDPSWLPESLSEYDVMILDVRNSLSQTEKNKIKAFISDSNKKTIALGMGWVWSNYWADGTGGDPDQYPLDDLISETGIKYTKDGWSIDGQYTFYPYTLYENIASDQTSCLDLDRDGNMDGQDSDGDGISNDSDNCPTTSNTDQSDVDGDGVGDACDPDDDNDGILDENDNCPTTFNTSQIDTDGDGQGDACDSDDDNDGILDEADNCPTIANDQSDSDGDGIGDSCDSNSDSDGDGILDENDNCPTISNEDQTDTDQDGIGNVCDPDDDNDSLLDENDNCPTIFNTNQLDADQDGVGNDCDPDDDNDGILDENDNCPTISNEDQTDADQDGIGNVCDPDDDNDSLLDENDNCPTVFNTNQLDTDQDGVGNDCDLDDDNDGVLDENDTCPNTFVQPNTIMDVNGCQVILLPANNFSVEVISASCIGKENGMIQITALNSSYNYYVSINNSDVPFSLNQANNFTSLLTGLGPEEYQICIFIQEQEEYSHCFTVKIIEPAPLFARSRISESGKKATFDLSGSFKYLINHNGELTTYSNNEISLDLKPGQNIIKISTDLDCQGSYTEEIFVSEKIIFYPNPTDDYLQIYVSGQDHQVALELLDISGNFIREERKNVSSNRVVEIDLSSLDTGIYIIKVVGNTVNEAIKVVKK